MGVALSMVILFTVSSTIVRIASVILEHSGVPRPVARLQAISALTGAGFTTAESELLLQTPERRKVLMVLLITGGLGLSSVVATLVLGALGVSATRSGLLMQAGSLLVALLYLRYVLFTRWADQAVCGLALRWLERQGSGMMSYLVLHRLGEDSTVAEHRLARLLPLDSAQWGKASSLIPLGVRASDGHVRHGWPAATEVGQGVILSGPIEAHAAFATEYGQPVNNLSH